MKKKRGMFSNLLGLSNIQMGFAYTKQSIGRIISSRRDFRVETFEDACRRFDIVGDETVVNPILQAKFKQHKNNFIIKFSAGLLVFIASFYYIFILGQILNGLMFFLLSITIYSFSLDDSLNCFRINKRELGLFNVWLKNPANWFPRKFNNEPYTVTKEKIEDGEAQ